MRLMHSIGIYITSPNLKVLSVLVCLVALILVPVQMAHPKQGFLLKMNLWDGNSHSGKVKVFVLSETTNSKKSKSLDVGKLSTESGDSRVDNIIRFRFTDKQLPPNGAFSACVVSIDYGTQCEEADRHYEATSAVMWVQVPR